MAKKLFDLTGRVAIVTGASKGLGRAMAMGMAEAGATMVLVSRTAHLLDKTAAVIAAGGGKAIVAPGDVTNEKDMENIVDSAMKEFNRIDILVNNAGMAPMTRAMDISTEEWKTVMDTNLNSAFYACRSAGRRMMEAKCGKIINISSILARLAGNSALHYCSAKAAIVQMARALALEWARFNIRVNCIAPGYFDTEMTVALRSTEKQIDFLQSRIPMGRVGEPEELVGAAVFLASDASSYVTGATLFVDGGYTVW